MRTVKVGVIIPIEDWRGGGVEPLLSWSAIKRLAQQVDAAGFDSLWMSGDHLIYRPGDPIMPGMTQPQGMWEGWTMLTALAAVTERVEIGAWVICGLFRNPALLAKMAATLDEVSGGRLILGLGAGWHRAEFTAFGFPFDHRADRFEEVLQILVPLLREGRVDFRGTYYQAQCELVPRGPRPHGPPILIAAYRPRMQRLAAQYADSWHGQGRWDPAAIFTACAEVGRDPKTIELTRTITAYYPDLGRVPPSVSAAEIGTSAVVAQLRTCEEAGVGHVQCKVYPRTPEALARLAEGLAAHRRGIDGVESTVG
jgi:alkanesulfonate monooxygenase SsuD/methylene tetrahydromethanopterin reductase-like flavin-dependent oxidoreductase (luciferase family)